MTALNRTFTFAEMNDLAMLVAKKLEFDVPRMFNEPLGVNIRRAEGLLRFTARRFVCREKLFLLAHHAHATSATARHRLQNEWVTDFCSFLGKLLFSLNRAVTARNRRKARAFHLAPRAVLLSHHFDDLGPRTDKRDLGRLTNLGEVRIF